MKSPKHHSEMKAVRIRDIVMIVCIIVPFTFISLRTA
jgi:hypothetical protein